MGRGILSEDAARVYAAVSRQDPIPPEDTHHIDELVAWGLVGYSPDRPGIPVVLNPREAIQRRIESEIEGARRRVERLMALPGLAEQLGMHFDRAQWRSAGGCEFLDDPHTVNARLDDAVAGARTEILAAQPGGPRTRMVLERSVARDQEALARGVELRTLYRDTVRDTKVTAEYARIMTGMGAAYRTLVGPYERCIVVDRRIAFISDHVVDGAGEHAAWCVTDRAMVAYVAAEFEGKWRRANPWRGELRCQSDDSGTAAGGPAGGVGTTRRQREIARCLVSGMKTETVARRIGISQRKTVEEIAVLKALAGVSTLAELGFWWATCPDRLIDDTECPGDADGPGPTGAAVA